MTLVRGVSFQLLAQAIAVLTSLAALPLLSRQLGVDGYGVFVTVMAFCALLSAVSDLGLGATTVREVASRRLDDGRAIGTAISIRALNSAFVVLGGIAVAVAMRQPPAVVIGIAVAAVYVLLLGVYAVGPNVVLQVRARFGWVAVAAAIQGGVWLVGVGVVVLGNLDSVGAIVALSLAALAGLTVSAWAGSRMLDTPLAFDRRVARALLGQGISLGVASLLAMAYYRIDAILLPALAGMTAAGLYGAAYRFVDQARLVASYIGTAGHATVARAASDETAFRASVAHMVRFAAVAGVAIAVALFVLADPLVQILFGAHFADAPQLLRVLALAVLPMFLNNVIPYAMIAQRRQAVYVWINLGALALNLGGNVLLIPRFGPLASAWLTVLTEIVVLCSSLAAVWWALRFVPGLGFLRPSRQAVA